MDSEAELGSKQRAAELIGALSRLHGIATLLLTAPADDALWSERVRALAQKLGELQLGEPDAVLYLLYYAAVRKVERYSSHHALVCAATAAACAQQLGWDEADIRSLACAALTMNVSITALQDELVYRERTLTLDQRLAIERHPAQSVELLTTLGVTDSLWLQAVELHHVDPPVESKLEDMAPGQRLGALLRRVDVLTAKLSPRNARKGMAPTLALRDAYLGGRGTADAIGLAIIRALGAYPPGSLVTLTNGEIAIVLRRGERANGPVVASLLGPDKAVLVPPALRDSTDSLLQVKGPARIEDARLPIDHVRLLALAATAV
ncbi:HD domain-containing phosphohydrolase [uncultured Methylibium sp.]|uniref:HD-GYP domain-containing protein n=1 Tax=uncultured Methylibium sp. TaxID=381093 RepID=UPI0025FFE3B5|nr:HD domain-containing phosphohydrolase [uncultured Methylibium sp.]